MLTVTSFVLGPFETNCFVLAFGDDAGAGDARDTKHQPTRCWVVDAGYEPDPMIEHIQSHNLVPEAIILTHAHADHIAGLRKMRAAFPGTPVLIHEAERDWLADPQKNLSAAVGIPVTASPPDRLLSGDDLLVPGTLATSTTPTTTLTTTPTPPTTTASTDNPAFQVLATPGHSPGGITLYCPARKIAFVGDSLFASSIGRTDFPGSDFATLAKSIREKLYTLPDDTRVMPGHGPETTIGHERISNPFVQEQE